MAWLEELQLVAASGDPSPLTDGALLLGSGHRGHDLTVIDSGAGTIRWLALSEDGAMPLDAAVLGEEPRIAASGSGGSLSWPVLQAGFDAWDAGETDSFHTYLGDTPSYGMRAVVLTARLDSGPAVFIAGPTADAPRAYGLEGGTLALRSAGETHPYSEGTSAMALVTAEGTPFLYTGSATAHGIAGYRVTASGALEPAGGLGMAESLPLAGVSALAAAETGGRSYLLAGASGSSSLTVLQVAEDGALEPTDHVIDSLHTRFGTVAHLETIALGERVYVFAAGADAGLSAFALTPAGTLVHLESLADTTTRPLDAVSALAATGAGTAVEVLAASATEARIARFRLEAASTGTATIGEGTIDGGTGDDILSLAGGDGRLSGGAGRDILEDGPGSDTLRGGEGEDIFVLTADGTRDVIEDLTPGADVLDLSGWAFLHDAAQLAVETTAQGAVLRYGDEELVLRTADGAPLEVDDIPALLRQGPSRVTITLGELQVAPEPEPLGPPLVPPPPTMPAQDPADPAPSPDPAPTPSESPETDGFLLIGSDGADQLTGGDGPDTLAGADGPDTLSGSGGDDNIAGSGGADVVIGGEGRDSIGGGEGADLVTGGPGADVIGAGRGDDSIDGGAGPDRMSGGAGEDTLLGGAGDDTMGASYGHDVLYGEGGDDSLGGGTGRDTLEGGAGADAIGGGEGDDVIAGGEGHDFLAGGGRDDSIDGGDGDDRINGGDGDDTMTGGAGADEFVYNFFKDGDADVITDYEDGVDSFRMSGIDNAPGSGLQGYVDALNISDTAEGALMDYRGHTILLEGVAASELGLEDFTFL
ncbi:hypothetical protein DRV85_12260 [Rhodosalinus halophilus]|uniref:Uncharacterized protein n=1 Tax=Rhodosalinus halophilus TaxID=2259333 RepID=A0A365U7L9_9RHOB|nr:calcium-binding protein [Rhodosalinus halophilus]RBI84716.1 hypothetical protein DRV85_12260 [Rhodosalinus halophilus]